MGGGGWGWQHLVSGYQHHTSLWWTMAVQLLAAIVFVLGLTAFSRRWLLDWFPPDRLVPARFVQKLLPGRCVLQRLLDNLLPVGDDALHLHIGHQRALGTSGGAHLWIEEQQVAASEKRFRPCLIQDNPAVHPGSDRKSDARREVGFDQPGDHIY